MSSKQARKITLVGASGNVGSQTLSALISQNIHTITVLQRPESTATYPPSVTVKQGPLSDEAFVASALAGEDILVLQLSRFAMDLQPALIRAAATAGVKYLLPTEFGSDPDAKLVESFHVLGDKRAPRELVEHLGVSSWVGVVTNPWLDFGLQMQAWGFDVKERKATLWGGGNTKINTVSVKRVGEATAELLALPDAELEKYRNKSFFISSFHITHRDLFESVLRLTKTSEADWEVSTPESEQVAKECDEKMKAGDMKGYMTKFYMMHFWKGQGGDFDHKADSKRFGLPAEDLDEVVEKGLQSASP